MRNRIFAAILGLSVVAAVGVGGCGYMVGSTLPTGVRSVYVPIFVNKTKEPRIEFDATNATRTELQKDGTLQITSEDQADAVLKVVITGYDLEPLAYDPNRRARTTEYRVLLTVAMVLEDIRTGETIASKSKIQGESTFVLTGDLGAAKRDALPDAAKDLAHDIVEKLVEAW